MSLEKYRRPERTIRSQRPSVPRGLPVDSWALLHRKATVSVPPGETDIGRSTLLLRQLETTPVARETRVRVTRSRAAAGADPAIPSLRINNRPQHRSASLAANTALRQVGAPTFRRPLVSTSIKHEPRPRASARQSVVTHVLGAVWHERKRGCRAVLGTSTCMLRIMLRAVHT